MPDNEAIVASEQGEIDHLSGHTTEISWEPSRPLSYDEWYTAGLTLKIIGKAIPFWLGDFLAYGERNFGEDFAQFIDESEYARETLKKFKSVATRIPKERRLLGQSWTAHFAVCYLEPRDADRILAIADEHELTTRDVKAIARLERKEEFFDFVDNQIQLRDAEVMAEAARLCLPEPEVDEIESQPELMRGEIVDDDDEEIPFSHAYEDDDDEDIAWVPDDPLDEIKQFFAERGMPIVYADDKAIVWEGGVRLFVTRSDREAFLNWEITT